MKRLSVAEEYSKRTGLRYSAISDFSGEDFYHKLLNAQFADAVVRNEILELSFDGTDDGCGPSFIDESVGNLVYDFTLEVVLERLCIISNDMPMWLDMIREETYPDWETRRIKKDEPKKTVEHPAWVRLVKKDKLETDVWISQITPLKNI